jgi:hypothetical protein
VPSRRAATSAARLEDRNFQFFAFVVNLAGARQVRAKSSRSQLAAVPEMEQSCRPGERDMASTTEEIGLLLVHGVGEQEKLEHLEATARQLASAITDVPGLIRLSVLDDMADSKTITIDAKFKRGRVEERIRLHLREVWWADLGIKSGVLEQLKFWMWGLGQWAAEVVTQGDPRRNTMKLMANPRFGDADAAMAQPGLLRRIMPRLLLFGAALLAFLTFFTWSAAKRVVALLSKSLPEPSLIFLFLGDVKTYEEPGGLGKGTLLDPEQPVRTTIRRRMVSEAVAMAAHGYDRWYIFAHSLGTVPAYNFLQETEWALPNYLTEAEWKALPRSFKTAKPFTPAKETPSTDRMMPRRPPWLVATEGIDRCALFERFAGLVTYGCPLDKFAALWPRVVPLNRQAAVFPRKSEWVNLYDPTDPVSASLDAFAPPPNRADADGAHRIALQPKNFATRASLLFGVSHIHYFRPRRKTQNSMPAAIAEALVSGGKTQLSDAAWKAAMTRGERWLRGLAAGVQLLVLAAALTIAAAALLIAIGKVLPDRVVDPVKDALGRVAPDLLALLQAGGWRTLYASGLIVLAAALLVIVASGLARMIADATRLPHK